MNSDLDNLKNGWSAFKKVSQDKEIHTKNQIEQMLKKDSKQISQRFKRMFLIETLIAVTLTVCFIVVAFTNQGFLRWLCSVLTLIYVVGCVWLANHLQKFSSQNNIEFNLYDSVQAQIRMAKEFISIYTKVNIILAATVTPIVFFIIIPLKKGDVPYMYFQELIQDENQVKLIFLSVIALIHAVVAAYLTRKTGHCYIKKTYGKYLEQLNTLKTQLSE